jgi:peptide/nickel transport system permease protein
MAATLLGVLFVTFAMLDLAPVDRAQLAVARAQQNVAFADLDARERALVRLRVRYGLLDAHTLEPEPLAWRFARWLGHAVTLRWHGPADEPRQFWGRLGRALPVTLLVGGLALLVGVLGGVWLGVRLGSRVGGPVDRLASSALFVLAGVPEFVLATLLTLLLASGGLGWLPGGGLQSPDGETLVWWARWLDGLWHLVLPVGVLATGPLVLVTRFVRDAAAKAGQQPFAVALRLLGGEPALLRRQLLRHGLLAAVPLAGSLLPMLVGGSIVVESVFHLDGMGQLAYRAAREQDQPMVMAVVVLTSVTTLVALLCADLLQHWLDPRVGRP